MVSASRNSVAWTVLLVAAGASAAAYWGIWTVAFLFGAEPWLILVLASIAAAAVAGGAVTLAGRIAGRRPRVPFAATAVLWLATSFLPERLIGGYSTIPPLSLSYQAPLCFLLASVLLIASRTRGKADA